jgi:hypothetical protein
VLREGSEKVQQMSSAEILNVEVSGVREVSDVKAFAVEMEKRGLADWWRKGMGWGE